MSSNLLFSIAAVLAAIALGSFSINQEPAQDNPSKSAQADDATTRIEKLEARVAELEKILFMTSSMTVFEAERRLEEARWQLQDSRQLLMQGFVTQLQFEIDEHHVRQLERELEFAKSPSGQQQLAISELEIIAAERKLAQAQYRLRATEQLAGRGYATDRELNRDRENLTIAEKNLASAREKLEAVRRLNEMENPSNQNKTPDKQPETDRNE